MSKPERGDRAENDSLAEASEKLPLAVKLAFGFPAFPGIGMTVPIAVFMTKFYADSIGVALGFIELAQTLARSVDAITDPLMGWLTDRTRTRWGRRRPWMLVGAPLTAMALVGLFAPPAGIGPLEGAVWFTTFFIAYYVFHTIYTIPHAGLGPELTSDYHERSNLFAWRDGMGVMGSAIASVAPAVVIVWAKSGGAGQAEAERAAFLWIALAIALMLVASYIWLCYRVPENPAYSRRKPNPLVPGVRRVIRNRPFRILLGAFLCSSIAITVNPLLMPFFLQYALGVDSWVEWTGVLMLVSYGVGTATIPLWLRLARRYGKKQTWIWSLWILVAFDLSLFAFPSFATGEAAMGWVVALFLLRGTSMTAGLFLAPAIQADVIDYDELYTGKRREAQYAALWSIATKLALIPALSLPLVLLAALGFEPNVEQTETVRWVIRGLYGLVPGIMVIGVVLIVRRFPIDERTHRATLAAIEAHRRGEPARDPITGRELGPPADRGLDEETGWILDHFSPGELRRALLAGSDWGRRLRRDIALALVLSTLVFGAGASGIWLSLRDLSSRPGVLTILCVLLAGVALAGLCFHGLRLRTARRRIGQIQPAEVRSHLEITEHLLGS